MPKNIATILMLVLAVASATADIRHYCDYSTVCLYDADGNKLRVVYKIDNRTLYAPEEIGDLPDDESAIETIMTRDYIGNHVYEDGTLERTIIDNGYITETDTYNFYIKDYQGNNVLTIEENAVK